MIPHDYEVETSILAAMMRYEKCLYEGISRFTDEHFFEPQHQVIFATIIRLTQKGQPKFKEVLVELRPEGYAEVLMNINRSIVSEEQFPIWADKLHELHVRRQYIFAAQEILDIAHDKTKSLESVADVVEKKILSVHQEESQSDIIEPQQAMLSAKEEHDKRLKSENKIPGIKLSSERFHNGKLIKDGFPSLDKTLMGIKGGDLILICAQSGEGKTAMAQNIVRHVSINQGYYTYYENTEMDPTEMVYRFVAQLSQVEFEKIYKAEYFGNEKELGHVNKAFEIFGKSHVYLSQLPTLTPQRSRGLARKFKMKYGQLDLVVIDYIGRMEVIEKGLREDQVLAMVAKESKKLAQELNCAVILLAQLTEDGKIEGARRVKNDADAVYFIERVEKGDNFAPEKASHRMVKYKVRRGSTDGYIYLAFNKAKMYITEVN